MSKVEEKAESSGKDLAPVVSTPPGKMGRMELTAAPLIESGMQLIGDVAEHMPFAPEEQAGGELPPMVMWEKPGNTAWGSLVQTELNVGPNKSRVYKLKHPRTGVEIGVWGTTVLDKAIDQLNPQPGDTVGIVYLGDVETSRNQNPAKLFRVLIQRAKPKR